MKRKYLLDSGVFVKYFRGERRAAEFLQRHFVLESYISVLTVTEILLGFKDKDKREKASSFLKLFPAVDVNWEIAKIAAELIRSKPDYFGKGVERGTIDAFIAATAVCHSLTLVTLNAKHFARLKFPNFFCVILKEQDKDWSV